MPAAVAYKKRLIYEQTYCTAHQKGTAYPMLVLAIVHTLCVGFFHKQALRVGLSTWRGRLLHFASEVEVVFGFWAVMFFLATALSDGLASAISYVENRNFTEPLFIFVILVISATRPILYMAEQIILKISRLLPFAPAKSFYLTALIIGPLLGSFITEPAAMTVTALLLRNTYFSNTSEKFKYLTLGLLFVNVSIGGVLTPYAAPPVLMVARQWGWDLQFMLVHFGWKAVLAACINTITICLLLNKEFKSLKMDVSTEAKPPISSSILNVLFLFIVVVTAHHPILFIAAFLIFLGVVHITQYNEGLKLREGLLVAIFLGGLVVLGGAQSWWLKPILLKLSEGQVFFWATAITAIVDNAALTYLGSQVDGLTETFKYLLVAGAVTGGGLTVIANAPNPAGFSILGKQFGGPISAIKLFRAAIIPTTVAAICFYFL